MLASLDSLHVAALANAFSRLGAGSPPLWQALALRARELGRLAATDYDNLVAACPAGTDFTGVTRLPEE